MVNDRVCTAPRSFSGYHMEEKKETLSEYMLLQTTDLELRQVSCGVMSGAPEWWRSRFGSAPKFIPKAMRQHLEMPVYGIDVPVHVLDVMLEMIQVPENKKEYWRHLPLSLSRGESQMTLLTWRGYMRAYGFVDTVDLGGDDDDLACSTARKRKGDDDSNAFRVKLKELASYVYNYFLKHHPRGNAFKHGSDRGLYLTFVTYYRSEQNELPGDLKPTSIPWLDPCDKQLELGHYLARYLTETQRDFFIACLQSLTPPTVTVSCSIKKQKPHRTQGATNDRLVGGWPFTSSSIEKKGIPTCFGEWVEIAFEYE